MSTFLCTSPQKTFAAAKNLSTFLEQGDVLGLCGNLGAGKTWFTQGVAQGLGLPKDIAVTSPTFALVNEYQGGRLSMVHMDLYRIENDLELEHLGLEEMLDRAGVALVEWCEKYPILPADHLRISLQIQDAQSRLLHIHATGPRSEKLAAQWLQVLRSIPG